MYRIIEVEKDTGKVTWEGSIRHPTLTRAYEILKLMSSPTVTDRHFRVIRWNEEQPVNGISIVKVIQYKERDYAIVYLENGIPRIDYRLDKNHEQHAVNSFTKERRTSGDRVTDDREQQEHTIEIMFDGKSVGFVEV